MPDEGDNFSGSLVLDFRLVRQSQIVQSVMQDYQYDLSHLLPVSNLSVQGPKKLTITVCQDGQGYCSDLR